ncbi:hypothetical protein F1737_05825 [Methanoplanus sp. FWC-SCC4]|uniref:DUF5050 domain-containing protein n=1 Tax=Methanochimaera problematica TaxID=2609417 RepID=A0AA97FCZ7_9EURY|nr:hypothetical protein [Methanoplanus sp. FWC-SCC4]WOF16262.1 hypothetical protein F1737_05825 [Methanoplanus sp. FWC-SCC4]
MWGIAKIKKIFPLISVFFIIASLSVVVFASAGEPVLFSEGHSYDPYVSGDYIVYTDFKDDPFGREPVWGRYGIVRGKPGFRPIPIGNTYLYNISSNETSPVYKSVCRSSFPWIEDDTVYWYEDRFSPAYYDPGDPNPADLFIYSVPIERINPQTAENYSLLKPDVSPGREILYGFNEIKRPEFSSNLTEVVQGDTGTSDLYMYYIDPDSGNKTLLASGPYLEYACPQLYGDRIFWEDCRLGYSQIYMFDLKGNQEYLIAPQYFSQYDCSVDGNIVAWTTYGGDLYYTNISGMVEEKTPEKNLKQTKPIKSGNHLLFFRFCFLLYHFSG